MIHSIYKKILSLSILFIYLATLLFSSIILPTSAFAQANCEIDKDKVAFSPGGIQGNWYSDDQQPNFEIIIETNNCEGEDLEVTLRGVGDVALLILDEKLLRVPSEEKLELSLVAGESKCLGVATPNCRLDLLIEHDGSAIFESDSSVSSHILQYNCEDSCLNDTYLLDHTGAPRDTCLVKNAFFKNYSGHQDVDFMNGTIPNIIIDINTVGCEGEDISVQIRETDDWEAGATGGVGEALYSDTSEPVNPQPPLDALTNITVPESEFIRLALIPGENECDFYTIDQLSGWISTSLLDQYFGGGFKQCRYFIRVTTPDQIYESWFRHPQGRIQYDCRDFAIINNKAICSEDNAWKFLSSSAGGQNTQTIIGETPSYEKGEACVNEEGTGLRPNCYAVLAPLSPDLLEVETGVDGDFTLGKYINIIVNIVIGVAGLLAVVMIIFGGVQYMTTDAIAGKSEAKGTITNAILGLLIALSSFVILNTINPQLTNIDPDVQSVSLQVQSDAALWLETESDDISNYGLVGTFETPTTSPGVDDFVQSLENNSSVKLARIVVNTPGVGAGIKGTATFIATNGEKVTVDVGLGKNGVVQNADAEQGDGKTPIIKTTINSDIRPPGGPQKNTPATSTTLDTTVNMGAMYAMMNITVNTAKGRVLRGIGFHGHRTSNSLGVTNGCIRMKNDDLVALGKYMKAGTNVWIE